MKRIRLDSVQKGDILLTARPGKLSKAIRASTGGIVSHAMICVQHGSFIDSTSDGVQARNLQREVFEDDEQIFHFRLKNPITQAAMARVVNFARAQIGTRYSVSEAVRSVVPASRPRSRRQFCSRLVAQAYKNAGIDLVADADYCTPEDLRESSLLVEIPTRTEIVTDKDLRWIADLLNPVHAMHKAQNSVLEVARRYDSKVESFDDLFSLLVQQPDVDDQIAAALVNSGYLDLWRSEVQAHPWRYDSTIMNQMTDPSLQDDLKWYCSGTLSEAYSGGLRYAVTLIQIQTLHERFPRKTFGLEVGLYRILVKNDEIRREVAYEWLKANFPKDLRLCMEQIEPHSEYWYSIIDLVEPNLAALSRCAVSNAGSAEVCSSCGDEPWKDFRLANGSEVMLGVPSLRLCDDCLEIRRAMNNVLVPFL